MTTQDIEGTLTLCYQQLIQSLLARFFRGDYRIDFARSCMHASTVQSPTDRSSFATLLEGHFQVFNRAGEEFRMHWGATVGKLVPQRKPPSSPALWIKIAAGNDSTLDDDDAAMWNKMKFLDLNFNRALPQYIFSLEDPEDLNNKLFVKEGVLAAAISNDVKIEHFSDGFFNAHFTEHGTKKSVTLALGELSQCLQFGLANQIEARLQQGELRDGR